MSYVRHKFRQPPRTQNYEGQERRVGVEVEFAAVSAGRVANAIRDLFGGEVRQKDPHSFIISGTRFGEFKTELDTQYAHRSDGSAAGEGSGFQGMLNRFGDVAREVFGDISSLVMPQEAVCPPVALSQLSELEQLLEALRELGAQGTRASPFYAFGVQLNPELATRDADWIASMLKAYLLLSDWLRAIMNVDVTRRVAAFSDPFPSHYVLATVHPDYWPPVQRLIDDYLRSNPTRNRELDMLPMFAWFDEERVRRAVQDNRVKKRPTFHYRLPDANIGREGWSLMLEWNRWRLVEELAEDRERLNRMGAAYIENARHFIPKNWAVPASEWLLV